MEDAFTLTTMNYLQALRRIESLIQVRARECERLVSRVIVNGPSRARISADSRANFEFHCVRAFEFSWPPHFDRTSLIPLENRSRAQPRFTKGVVLLFYGIKKLYIGKNRPK